MIIEIQMTAFILMFALFFANPGCKFPNWGGTVRLFLYRLCLLVFIGATVVRIWS